jgi:hypothetical protein
MSTPYQFSIDDGEGRALDRQTGRQYDYLSPWYISGWSVQGNASGGLTYPDLVQGNANNLQYAPFPADQNYTRISQYYFVGDADPQGGFLTFMPSDDWVIIEDGVSWRMPKKLSGTETFTQLDAGVSPWAFSMMGSGAIYIWRGQLIVMLYATDNPSVTTVSGKPLTYHVVEHFLGGYQYDITVPTQTYPQTTNVDLYSLIVPGTMKPYKFDPVYPMGTLQESLWKELNSPEYILPTVTINHLATQYYDVNITAVLFGGNQQPVDIYPDLVYLAFMQGGNIPTDDDFYQADWANDSSPYTAQFLIGSGTNGLPLSVGQYQVWYKLVDDPQTLIGPAGILVIQ